MHRNLKWHAKYQRLLNSQILKPCSWGGTKFTTVDTKKFWIKTQLFQSIIMRYQYASYNRINYGLFETSTAFPERGVQDDFRHVWPVVCAYDNSKLYEIERSTISEI